MNRSTIAVCLLLAVLLACVASPLQQVSCDVVNRLNVQPLENGFLTKDQELKPDDTVPLPPLDATVLPAATRREAAVSPVLLVFIFLGAFLSAIAYYVYELNQKRAALQRPTKVRVNSNNNISREKIRFER